MFVGGGASVLLGGDQVPLDILLVLLPLGVAVFPGGDLESLAPSACRLDGALLDFESQILLWVGYGILKGLM